MVLLLSVAAVFDCLTLRHAIRWQGFVRVAGTCRCRQLVTSGWLLLGCRTAAGELLQLRLACIHPQLTSYWQQLSSEMQLGRGGALSMGEILGRMRDSTQVKLQATERDLCIALNALAAQLTAAAAALESAASAAAEPPAAASSSRDAKAKGKGKKRAAPAAAPAAGGAAAGSARKRVRFADGAGTSAAGAGDGDEAAATPGGGSQAAAPVDPAELRAEALLALEASFRWGRSGAWGATDAQASEVACWVRVWGQIREHPQRHSTQTSTCAHARRVGEHGIGAWSQAGRGGGETVDRAAGSANVAPAAVPGECLLQALAGGLPVVAASLLPASCCLPVRLHSALLHGPSDPEDEVPQDIASADASWRNWMFVQVGQHLLGVRRPLHSPRVPARPAPAVGPAARQRPLRSTRAQPAAACGAPAGQHVPGPGGCLRPSGPQPGGGQPDGHVQAQGRQPAGHHAGAVAAAPTPDHQQAAGVLNGQSTCLLGCAEADSEHSAACPP